MSASSISRDNEISIIELIDNIKLIVYGSLLKGAFLKMQDYANTTRRGAGLPYKWVSQLPREALKSYSTLFSINRRL
jgi:hypothetical protein